MPRGIARAYGKRALEKHKSCAKGADDGRQEQRDRQHRARAATTPNLKPIADGNLARNCDRRRRHHQQEHHGPNQQQQQKQHPQRQRRRRRRRRRSNAISSSNAAARSGPTCSGCSTASAPLRTALRRGLRSNARARAKEAGPASGWIHTRDPPAGRPACAWIERKV